MSTTEEGIKQSLKTEKSVKKETKMSSEAQQLAGSLPPLTQEDLQAMVKTADLDPKGGKIVREALAQEKAFRLRIAAELAALLEKLKKSASEQALEKLWQKTLAKLKTDLTLMEILNKELATKVSEGLAKYPVGSSDEPRKKTARYPLVFNKMAEAIQGALTFLTQDNCNTLSQAQSPRGYTYTTRPEEITLLQGDPNTIFGSSKGTFLKTAALTLYLSSTEKERLCDLDLTADGPYTRNWIDNSALVHSSSLPVGLELQQLDNRFRHFTYSFPGNRFAYIHSGYAFGDGLRGEKAYYRQGKTFAPKDCSSWIEHFCGLHYPLSTADQLHFYHAQTGVSYVPPQWDKTPAYRELEATFEVVPIKDPQKDLRPGQIYCVRHFNREVDPLMEKTSGKAGHTGVVLGFQSQGKDSQVVMLAYSRDMPKMEGFGVQQVPLFPEPKDGGKTLSKVMIFSIKGKVASGQAAPTATGQSATFALASEGSPASAPTAAKVNENLKSSR